MINPDALPDRIAEVRQPYLDTLADWPVDGLPAVDQYAEKAARKSQGLRSPRPREKWRRLRRFAAANKGAAATKAVTKKASPITNPANSRSLAAMQEASHRRSSAKGRS